jgi:hypothetical protein
MKLCRTVGSGPRYTAGQAEAVMPRRESVNGSCLWVLQRDCDEASTFPSETEWGTGHATAGTESALNSRDRRRECAKAQEKKNYLTSH